MQSGNQPWNSLQLPSTAFQSSAKDALAQKLEGIAQEVRTFGTDGAGIYTSAETLGLLAGVLQGTLRKIDEVFEFEGFVFSPACILLLELFRARSRGTAITAEALRRNVCCPSSVANRWVEALISMQLVERLSGDQDAEARFTLTERGNLKVMEALQLLL